MANMLVRCEALQLQPLSVREQSLHCTTRRCELVTLFSLSHHSFTAVNFICDHPAIKAISFVGSNQAGEYIYERGSRNGKRVQSNMVRLEQQVVALAVNVQQAATMANRCLNLFASRCRLSSSDQLFNEMGC